MINDIIKDSKERMGKTVDVLRAELKKLRTGRAHPSILEHVTVDYYGSDVPISQVANVVVEDARTLSVKPWEKPMVGAVEKAILTSDLGLNPATSGEVIRIPMPPLTEERRRDLVKVVKQEAENSKIAVRNIRRDANNDFRDLQKDKEITEDEERRAQDDIQKLTDSVIGEIDAVAAEKETDLMTM